MRRNVMRKRNFTKQVGLILSEETYSRLIEQTNKEEVTVSEWIRNVIDKELFQAKKGEEE